MKNKTCNVIELLEQINNKKKELKLLNQKYKAAFADICKSWVEQTKSAFPNLQPCNIDERVGVDVCLNGRIYNIFISDSGYRLFCMFSLDRKDHDTFSLDITKIMDKKDSEKLKVFFDSYSIEHKAKIYYHNHGYFIYFKRENYQEAFKFFLELVRTFV